MLFPQIACFCIERHCVDTQGLSGRKALFQGKVQSPQEALRKYWTLALQLLTEMEKNWVQRSAVEAQLRPLGRIQLMRQSSRIDRTAASPLFSIIMYYDYVLYI